MRLSASQVPLNRRSRWLLFVLFFAGDGFSHPPFPAYIQHQTGIYIGSQNIDIELELTFFNTVALRERNDMDADDDGQISREETIHYLKAHEEGFLDSLRLRINQQSLPIVSLYEPEMDLLADTRTAPSPFLIRLYYFSHTPQELASGGTVELDDRLFPTDPAVCHWFFTLSDESAPQEKPHAGYWLSPKYETQPRRALARIGPSHPAHSRTALPLSTLYPCLTHIQCVPMALLVPGFPAMASGWASAGFSLYFPWRERLMNTWGGS